MFCWRRSPDLLRRFPVGAGRVAAQADAAVLRLVPSCRRYHTLRPDRRRRLDAGQSHGRPDAGADRRYTQVGREHAELPVPVPLGEFLLQLPHSAQASGWAGQVLHGGRIFSSVAGFLEAVVVIFVVGIFGAAEPDIYKAGLFHLVPPRHRPRVRRSGGRCDVQPPRLAGGAGRPHGRIGRDDGRGAGAAGSPFRAWRWVLSPAFWRSSLTSGRGCRRYPRRSSP